MVPRFMQVRGLVGAILLLAAPAAAAQPAAAPPGPSPGQPLADRVEVAFRACALQLTQRDYLMQGNAAGLERVGITPGATPPADVRAMAGWLFGDRSLYASVTTPVGGMWIAASATVPACKVTLADTELAMTARYLWDGKLRKTANWTYDEARSGARDGITRDVFTLNPGRPGPHMIVILDGPWVIANQGRGIQLIMTVTIEPAGKPSASPGSPPPAAGQAAALGDQFARALVEICPAVAVSGSFAGLKTVTRLERPPTFHAAYAATGWYALESAPDTVFLSLDAVPGVIRCRVALAGGTGPAAHRAAIAALQRAGARAVAPMAFAAKRGLMESVWVLPRTGGATLFLVQTAPEDVPADRPLQGTATAKAITDDEVRALRLAF